MRNNCFVMKRPLLYFFILLLVSCGPPENPEQLREVNESLERANNVIIEANKLMDLQWEMHLKDPQVASLAHGVLQQINQVNGYADSVRQVITELKSELIKQSKDLEMDYVPIARQLYDVNGAGYQLFSRMATFKDSIPAILGASENVNRLLDTIPLLKGFRDTLPADQRAKYAKKWLDKCFGRNSSLMAMIMLNKIENDVLTTEKILLDFINSGVCIHPIYYDR
jgi:hypothetical protein